MRGRWPRQGLPAPHPACRCEPLRVSHRFNQTTFCKRSATEGIDLGQSTRKKLGFPGFFHVFLSKMILRPVRGGESVNGRLGQSTMPSLAIRPSALTLLVCTSLLSTGLAGTRLLPGVFVLFRKERALQSTQASPSVRLASCLMMQAFPAELTGPPRPREPSPPMP